MDPLQPGCPLYPLSSILDPQAFLACSDPLSSDSKAVVDELGTVLEGASKEAAEDAKTKLEAAGAVIELK